MKKLLVLAMTLITALCLVAGCGSDGPKKMVVGLDDNFAPMGFRNEKNEIVTLIWHAKPANAQGLMLSSNLSTGLPKKLK